MTELWCEQAWLGGEAPVDSVLIGIGDGLITSVTQGVEAPPGARRLAGLTLPGFANAHSHAFHRALRGRTHGGEGSFWTWREEMYRVAAGLDPDSYHALALKVYREMLEAGYTVVGEFHYLHHDQTGEPYADPNAMSQALVAAANEVGIRITLLDTLYLHGGLDEGYSPPDEVQRRFSDGSVETWMQRLDAFSPSGLARAGAAIHSVRAVDPSSARVAAEYARARRLPLHAHLSEQPAENAACIDAHGTTPTGLLHEVGAFDAWFTAIHATHLTETDIRLLGEAQATVCFCPTTERDLADGIGPSAALVAAGARLAIGSDSQAVIDPFEEMRAVELNQRLATLQRGNHPVSDLLLAGTAHGYRSLGWSEGGRIAQGSLADFVTIDFDSARLSRIDRDQRLAAAVFCAATGDITSVLVAGRVVFGS